MTREILTLRDCPTTRLQVRENDETIIVESVPLLVVHQHELGSSPVRMGVKSGIPTQTSTCSWINPWSWPWVILVTVAENDFAYNYVFGHCTRQLRGRP